MTVPVAYPALTGLVADLVELSHAIHGRPELAYEEHFAHGLLTDFLRAQGFEVQPAACGIPTAFTARAGQGSPHIAVLCEYDALPKIGHGCGHNIIAAAGAGAGVAAAATLNGPGTVHVIGTPAEEYGGGKIVLGRRGAFDEIDVAMMIHPADVDLLRMETLARKEVTATYRGRAAHAASAPEAGVNALDAAVLGYLNIAALRQHILPTDRVHGIIRDGGDVPNIVPSHAKTEWNVRSLTSTRLDELVVRVDGALRAAGPATGCEVDLSWGEAPYAEMRDHAELLDVFRRCGSDYGRTFQEPGVAGRVAGSTDMGNVSHWVPAIHPVIQTAESGTALHSAAFAEAAITPLADRAVLDGASILAATAAQLFEDGIRTAALRQAVPYGGRRWSDEEAGQTGLDERR